MRYLIPLFLVLAACNGQTDVAPADNGNNIVSDTTNCNAPDKPCR